MFEKEAKKWVKEHTEIEYKASYGEFSQEPSAIKSFKAGAEFGYNKANEWHYVKDGDLPKDKKDMLMSKTLLLVTKMKGSDCLSLALGEYNFSTQEFSYQHIVGLTDVIAWKEIILPKEIKENE